MGHGRHQGMAGHPEVEGAELEIEICRPFGEALPAAGEFEKMRCLGDPDQGQAGLGQILRDFERAVSGTDEQDGLLWVLGLKRIYS